jgi:hypothetical protein
VRAMPTIDEMKRLGWGDPNSPSFRSDYIVTIRPVKGLELNVHRAAAPIFKELVQGIEKAGANLTQHKDDWSYFNRSIDGYAPSIKSYHAWGLAIDLDATEQPMGQPHTTFPVAKTRLLVDSLRFVVWGYEWQSSRPDPMHFEIRGRRRAVRRFSRRLQRHGL